MAELLQYKDLAKDALNATRKTEKQSTYVRAEWAKDRAKLGSGILGTELQPVVKGLQEILQSLQIMSGHKIVASAGAAQRMDVPAVSLSQQLATPKFTHFVDFV